MNGAGDRLVSAKGSDDRLRDFQDLGKQPGHELCGMSSVRRGLRIGWFRPKSELGLHGVILF